MKPEETIDFHVRWIWAKISRLYNVEAAKVDGTMSIGYTLLNIDREGTPSTKLGPKMGMESRSLTRTLSSMEDNGLIVRKKDDVDKRMMRVFLTPKGREMRDHSRDVVLKFNAFMRQYIDEEKLENFFDVMKQINHLMDKTDLFENEKMNTQKA